MSYTVKKLAKLSGVSSRTLRFYDEISLLKPGYYGANNYRYYEEEQLLELQQILFFRELGFSLSDIQRIIRCDDFNRIETLKSHKNILKQDLERTQNLIKTIDKTIAHLRGEIAMKNEELYYGLNSEKQKGYEREIIKKGWMSENEMSKYRKNLKKGDSEKYKKESDKILKTLLEVMQKQLEPNLPEVQNLVRGYYNLNGGSTLFPDKERYLGLIELYQTDEFKKFFDYYDPALLEYMVKGMKIFAETELN